MIAKIKYGEVNEIRVDTAVHAGDIVYPSVQQLARISRSHLSTNLPLNDRTYFTRNDGVEPHTSWLRNSPTFQECNFRVWTNIKRF